MGWYSIGLASYESMTLLTGIRKVMDDLLNIVRKSPSARSSSAQAFLNLAHQNVRSMEALVYGEKLRLNERQCVALSTKPQTVHNIQEDLFGPALENLYRISEKAKLLVNKCCKDDWIAEVIFQIGNAQGFQVILLEVSLCYHAMYEEAKDMSDAWNFQHDDLRKYSTFRPAPISVVQSDQDALKQRLEGLVSSQQSNSKQSGRYNQQCLARYLLVAWEFLPFRTCI